MKPLVIIPQHFGSLLFDHSTSRYLPFDHAATAVLRALVTAPAREVLTSHADADAALEFVMTLDRQGLLAPSTQLPADILLADPPSDHLLGPLAVHLEVIGACNLKCGHCFAAPLPRQHDPLTLHELDRLFRDLAAIGAFRLGLTGGEPLLRRDLLDVLDLALAAGLHPCLTTNGFYLTDELARELGRRPLVWLNVSLDGATADTNDALRGAGSFDVVTTRLRSLAGHARFTLAFTLTSQNVHEVDRCVALAGSVGAHTAVFRPLYPVGAARHRPDLLPEFSAYQNALRCLGEDVDNLHAIDPFSPQARARTAGRVHEGGCGAGNTVCSISVQGQVNPCSFLGTDFDTGSVRDRPFRELWDEGATLLALRGTDEEFVGGCRARALALNGSVHAADPWERQWREEAGLHPGRTIEVLRG